MAYQRQQGLQNQLQAGDVLVVVHDFDARSTDELTLRRGERIELVELDDGFGDGWFLGKHLSRGGTGLFPGVYTVKVPAVVSIPPASATSQRSSMPSQPYSLQGPNPSQSPRLSQQSGPSSHSPSFQSFGTPTESDTASSSTSYGASYPAATNSSPASSAQNNSVSALQRSIGQALAESHPREDSPVMNQTLSVIDEHMQDLSTPRQSATIHELAADNDSQSEYSSHIDRRPSFTRTETEEDDEGLSVEQVKRWDHRKTANHLRELGVDAKHCDIFEEQEITGDVLLEMDQAFIYMKEYDFGVMGRRLKTWHKIRDFQDHVRGSNSSRQSATASSARNDSSEELVRSQSRVGAGTPAMLSRIPNLTEKSGLAYRQSQGYSGPTNDMSHIAPLQTQTTHMQRGHMQQETPPSPWRTTMAAESPSRPSAAQIRELSHSRRHSSIDLDQQANSNLPLASIDSPTMPHRKQASLDRGWTMSSAQPPTQMRMTPPLRLNTLKQHTFEDSSDPLAHVDPSSVDLDRGYFSGGEIENRKNRNLLRKRDSVGSPVHSRQSSMLEDTKKDIVAVKRHSRLSSVDSVRDTVPPVTSSAAKAYHSRNFRGRFRSASARTATMPTANGAISPTVTNLEGDQSSFRNPPAPFTGENAVNRNLTVSDKARRVIGMRAISDAITGSEKNLVTSPGGLPSTRPESPVQSPTGSSTPSGASKSFEIDNTDTSSKGTDAASSMLSPQISSRARPKAKKETSAYTRGLLNMSPQEARKTCDYSGWMKKKSSSLITTWKPRLFILRGRRLSYYYSEDDKMERGIIDISGHKVLAADSDPIIALHAQLTGATASPVPGYPSQGTDSKSTETSPTASRSKAGASVSSPFYFKLVPPKAGLSRAVQFTKPTIHYFQVDSLVGGRKWMGEMMKATIEHDLSSFQTTNKQKTISLAKARARKERPPALKGAEEEGEQENKAPQIQMETETAGGLQIHGLDFETSGQRGNSLGLLDEKLNGLEPSNTSFMDTGQPPQG